MYHFIDNIQVDEEKFQIIDYSYGLTLSGIPGSYNHSFVWESSNNAYEDHKITPLEIKNAVGKLVIHAVIKNLTNHRFIS
ncbi:MAG: hypothetical protein OXE77_00070 [Flavobacteriaceae bacterium]|nr:hypothetical protein [Flavobacteriaceae bacterium]MCY4267011.1 hypothetical protein [Flavobacteriaceae bacterium]